MFDFWYELPPLLRAVMGLAMMAIAVLIFFFTAGHLLAYGLFIVGLVFLMACKAGSGGGGYNF